MIALDGSPNELQAAILLSPTHTVRVRCDPKHAQELKLHQFIEMPRSIECAVACPFGFEILTRNVHKAVEAALDTWDDLGVNVSVGTVGSFGAERLLDEIYFPIFVQQFYARGISPYGAHNIEEFRRVARPDCYLITVEVGSVIRGAALLRERSVPHASLSFGGPAPDRAVEGLICAAAPPLYDSRRAFIPIIANALAEMGFGMLSLGKDLPYMGPAYAGSFLQKMRMAEIFFVNTGALSDLYRWHTNGSMFGVEIAGPMVKSFILGQSIDVFQCLTERIHGRIRSDGE